MIRFIVDFILLSLIAAGRANISITVNGITDQSQLAFNVSARSFEGVRVYGQRRAQHDQRSAVLWCAHRLFDAQAPDGLHRHTDSLRDFAQLIQRTGTNAAACDNSTALVVA